MTDSVHVSQSLQNHVIREQSLSLFDAPLNYPMTENALDTSAFEGTQCGLFCWKGKAWQKLASIKLYVLIYGILGLLQFAIGSYQVSIVSTIEKRFKIPSRTSGFILSSWDIGSLLCLVFLAYVGSRGHKPRWVAAGTVLMSLACFLWYLPHHVYGPGGIDNSTLLDVSSAKCELGPLNSEICSEGEESRLSAAMIFMANVLLGVGSCVYFTLGIAYLDDNSRKNKMPWLLASTMCIRMFGPTLGFMLGSYVLSIYNDPTIDPGITTEDPRWIGAWWKGWIPLAILNLLFAVFMIPFPRHLPRAYQRKIDAGVAIDDSQLSFKDFRKMLGRLVKNKVLVLNSVSGTFYMFGMMGYWTFMPKYLESQFQQSASEANFITGSVGLMCTGLGTLCSGFVISRYKPSPSSLALWNVIVESIDVIGHASYAFLGCPAENLFGHWEQNEWSMQDTCNEICSCPPTIKYTPLCSQDGSTLFYSPCHAGCLSGSFDQSLQVYQNCSCSPQIPLIPGACPLKCAMKFNIFLAILCTMRFFSASGRAGNTIIQFRSVSEGDKAVAIGMSEALFAALAFIPSPIFYGYLLDHACLVWGYICGEKGNCWLYDGRTVRYYINFASSGFILLATLADIGVWKYSSTLEIYDEEEPKPQELQPLDTKHNTFKEDNNIEDKYTDVDG